MASKQTENYGLNQWEAGDKVLREEFNGDNLKIDGALTAVQASINSGLSDLRSTVSGQAPAIHRGSYTGTGTAGKSRYSVGFRPRLVAVWAEDTATTFHQLGFLGMEGMCCFFASNGYSGVERNLVSFDSSGFTVDHSLLPVDTAFNRASVRYGYWAMK